MLQAQLSRSARNSQLRKATRTSGSNSAWITQNRTSAEVHVVLFGGVSTWAQRLRVAQSHLRHDMTPSHWSHVALLGPAQVTFEIPLFPRRSYDMRPLENGVLKGKLDDYDAAEEYPNVCVFALPLAWKEVQRKVREFSVQRTNIDALELQLSWLAFAWGVGRTVNPLYDRIGFASAALLEYVASSLDYDLTPAFPSSSSCPEAIWQAAIYWYEATRSSAGAQEPPSVSGAYVTEHDEVQAPKRGARKTATRARA